MSQRSRRPLSVLAVLAVAALLVLGSQACAEEPPVPAGVVVDRGVRIPLRDGAHLNANVYRPAGKEPLPVVWTLTPYKAATYHERGLAFAQQGYVFAVVDVRGSGGSEGTFEPHVNDGRDGYDAVEWLARQPWSNGKVGMWGGSYTGVAQWMMLKERPPHLVTLAPAASGYPGLDFPMTRNVILPYACQWLSIVSGPLADQAFWTGKFRELYRTRRPLRELNEIAGNRCPLFQTWLAHPSIDQYWKSMVPSRDDYARADLPILTVTGYFDGNQLGALRHYREHMAHAGAAARSRHYLILGPWDHGGTRKPAREVGGLTFGAASVVDMAEIQRQWFDWTLKGGPRPEFLKQRIAYYVTGPGAETWRYADDLGSIATERRTLYLAPEGRLAAAVPARSAPDRWVYDPIDVRPGEQEEGPIPGLTDQSLVRTLGERGLVYHTEPFAEPTEITGDVRLTLYASLDVPDTDFQATLYEVLPDGSSVLLGTDRLRARYRNSPEKPELVPLGEIQRYVFDVFPWFSRRIAAGSRLRLVVLSPNSIYFQKNYNGGGVVADESGKAARTAHVTLYHDAEHPSALEVPVVR